MSSEASGTWAAGALDLGIPSILPPGVPPPGSLPGAGGGVTEFDL